MEVFMVDDYVHDIPHCLLITVTSQGISKHGHGSIQYPS